MTTKREQLKQQIAELQAELDALPEVWEPKRGRYGIALGGPVHPVAASEPASVVPRGLTYATREQAEAVSEILRKVGRLCAAEIEYDPDEEVPHICFDEASQALKLVVSRELAYAIERGEVVL